MHKTGDTAKAGKYLNGWAAAALLLVIVILGGIWIIVSGRSRGAEIVITTMPEKPVVGEIYVGGEVNNPGWYTLYEDDGLNGLIRAAGGVKDGADVSRVTLTVSNTTGNVTAQRIDINRADVWLLEALPGVGEVKAQAVIEYRNANGIFHSIGELTNVPGFDDGILKNIQDLITVNEE